MEFCPFFSIEIYDGMGKYFYKLKPYDWLTLILCFFFCECSGQIESMLCVWVYILYASSIGAGIWLPFVHLRFQVVISGPMQA